VFKVHFNKTHTTSSNHESPLFALFVFKSQPHVLLHNLEHSQIKKSGSQEIGNALEKQRGFGRMFPWMYVAGKKYGAGGSKAEV
jgi:hypothetical protein